MKKLVRSLDDLLDVVARELPTGYSIRIEVEAGYGDVFLETEEKDHSFLHGVGDVDMPEALQNAMDEARLVEPEEYFILSLKWSKGRDYIVFWGPDNNGYTVDPTKAGRYRADKVASRASYYDDGIDTKAIPCRSILEQTIRVVPNESSILETWGAVYDQNAPKDRPWPYWAEAKGKETT